MKVKISVLALAILLVFMSLSVIPTSAKSSGTGTVNFWTVSGSGQSATCNVGTSWPTIATDGDIGFGGNLGAPNVVPTLSDGQLICIELVLSNQSPNTQYTVTSSGSTITLTPVVQGGNIFTTDGSGNVDVQMIFQASVTNGCQTNPIKISPNVAGADGADGGQIHHDANVGYPSCSTTSSTTTASTTLTTQTIPTTTQTTTTTFGAPQFPSILGFLAIAGIGVPIVLLLRKGLPKPKLN
jgi:hypothetical protein